MKHLQNYKPRVFKINAQKLSSKTLEKIIEYKISKLHELVVLTGKLTHPKVVRLSQEIDRYLLQLQKTKMNKIVPHQ